MTDLGDLGIKATEALLGLLSTAGLAITGVFFSRLSAVDAKIDKVKQEMFDAISALRTDFQDADEKIRSDADDANDRLRMELKSDISAALTRIEDRLRQTDDSLTEHRVYVERLIGGYATRAEIMGAFADLRSCLNKNG